MVRSTRLGLTALAFFVSGASALVYQVAWQRILALHTGVGIYSIALIVAAFMAGLGLGSHLGGAWSLRLSRRRALVAFGLLELGIALFGLASVPLYYDLLYTRGVALYASPWTAGLLHFASLLPPTCLMGMSLPFLVRAMVDAVDSAGRTIGILYGTNMLGASAGALVTPWLLVRHLGLPGAVAAAAFGNALAGLIALWLARSPATEDAVPPPPEPEGAGPRGLAERGEAPGHHSFALWAALYAVSGFCALSLEILWFRLLEVGTRATAFTFGTLLSTYLLGAALGCLAGARQAARWKRPLRVFLICQCGLLAWAGLSVLLLVFLPPDTPGLARLFAYWRSGGIFTLGDSWRPAALIGLYVLLPAVLFGPSTVLMGLSFPALQRAVQDDPRASGRKVGLLQAVNIAGCVAGSLLVGLVTLSSLGTAGSLRLLLTVGVGFASVGLWVYGRGSVFLALGAGLLALVVALPGGDRLWLRLHGATLPTVLTAEDATGVAAILPWENGWHVAVNGKHHSWLPYGGIHTRLGAIPSLVHPAPADVAIIGLGSGDTAWAAGCRRETRSLTVFEISGSQHVLLARLSAREEIKELHSFLADPRLLVRTEDGRRAIAQGNARFDVIEADALWPNAAWSGNLYSVEFFRECARRLKPGGLMCTWSPTPRILAAFRAAFPYVAAPGRQFFLLGSNQSIAIDPDAWRSRLREPSVAAYLGAARVEEVQNLMVKVRLLEGAEPPRDEEMNRDLYPRDEFLAP